MSLALVEDSECLPKSFTRYLRIVTCQFPLFSFPPKLFCHFFVNISTFGGELSKHVAAFMLRVPGRFRSARHWMPFIECHSNAKRGLYSRICGLWMPVYGNFHDFVERAVTYSKQITNRSGQILKPNFQTFKSLHWVALKFGSWVIKKRLCPDTSRRL